MEQAADAARLWCDGIAHFAKSEADQLSSGNYRLDDLSTAGVRLARVWVENTVKAAYVLSDNLALLAYTRPGTAAAPRTVRVGVEIPANTSGTLAVSDLVGQQLGHRIPSSTISISPDRFPAAEQVENISVAIEIRNPPAPNDLYEGRLHSADDAISVSFRVAINELGEPLPGYEPRG
ncbi:MAG: hypothetical protein ACRDSR_21460 [Pseudonocardiaceae bacterium]